MRSLVVCVLLLALPQAQAEGGDTWVDLAAGAEALLPAEVAGAPAPDPAVDQRLQARFNGRWFVGRDIELGAQYALEQRWRLSGAGADSNTGTVDGADFRWRDLASEPLDSDSGDDLRLYQNLDRLYGQFYTPIGDITLGRQAISFGLAKTFSPVDVVRPAGLQARERSYRPGVDAARALIPVGAVTELDLGWVAGEDDDLAFGRAYSQVGTATLEMTALSVNASQHLVGLGTQTALGDWGLWQEAAWLADDDEDGLRATLGVDQRILDDVYVMAEYHYNGLGGEADDGYAARTDSDFYQLGLIVPWGRHYLNLQASQPLTPLLDARLGANLNLGDGSALATGGLTWNLSNNARLALDAALPFGDDPDASGVPSDEFGVYPTQVSLNWSTVF